MNERSLTELEQQELANKFIFHATHAYSGATTENSSPLYAHLARGVADDAEVLDLLAGVEPHQQHANLLMGAVHYLLLSAIEHPLRDFYRSLTATPYSPENAYPYFHKFCIEHAAAIRRIVTTRIVQTNEVGRCTSLLPALGIVSQRFGNAPLTLIELGTSAGLNLMLDAYTYDYGAAGSYAGADSPVVLACEPRGNAVPPLPAMPLTIHERIGIDLNPIDIADPIEVRWLRALIWPEQQERVTLLEAAVSVLRQSAPTLIAGDLGEALPNVLRRVSPAANLCIFHSYTLNHCPQQTLDQLHATLADYGREHNFYRISLEYHASPKHPQLHLFSYVGGDIVEQQLAVCESHGRWIEWTAR